tara:strand:- start:82 stop:342 length:261 start_codon:yes stop_codon:yes gene_type:complete
MTAIIIAALIVYNIFLTLRIREVEDYVDYQAEELEITIEENNIKLYNKMIDFRSEAKKLQNIRGEKPRRRSTKSSSKVSKTKLSKS